MCVWLGYLYLTEKNLMQRVSICNSLLRHNNSEPFLKQFITGDEKWVTYDKTVRKRSWSMHGQAPQAVAKPSLIRDKVMLCGIVHYELLPPAKTIHSDLYC